MLGWIRDNVSNFVKPSEHRPAITTVPSSPNNSGDSSRISQANRRGTARRRETLGEELVNFTTKYPYSRPAFLEVTSRDELQAKLDHRERQIVLPKRCKLTRNCGYADCTNGGKSTLNEDQACAVDLDFFPSDTEGIHELIEPDVNSNIDLTKLQIFGVFDGHAGADVAVTVSHELPHRIKERLSDVMAKLRLASSTASAPEIGYNDRVILPMRIFKKMSVDDLVIGAVEKAFTDMDLNLIADEETYTVKGGCAAIVAIFYAGKVYVANAGDSRCVMKLGNEAIALSEDFTPSSERKRLQQIGEQHPELLGNEFCPRIFCQRVGKKDLGQKVLYQDSQMEGWAHKTIVAEDLRYPIISGEGRRARLLATIGVTRGFGDHNLQVFDSNIRIKPFLSCYPEVRSRDLSEISLGLNDVLIMGSDGLWDVTSNREAVDLVRDVLCDRPADDKTRYISAAQALVNRARGRRRDDRNIWVLDSGEYASHDDITCLVVPLLRNTVLLEAEDPIEQRPSEMGECSNPDIPSVLAEFNKRAETPVDTENNDGVSGTAEEMVDVGENEMDGKAETPANYGGADKKGRGDETASTAEMVDAGSSKVAAVGDTIAGTTADTTADYTADTTAGTTADSTADYTADTTAGTTADTTAGYTAGTTIDRECAEDKPTCSEPGK